MDRRLQKSQLIYVRSPARKVSLSSTTKGGRGLVEDIKATTKFIAVFQGVWKAPRDKAPDFLMLGVGRF